MAKLVKKIVRKKSSSSKAPLIVTSVDQATRAINALVAFANKNRAYSLDTETGGLRWKVDPLYMVQIYTPGMAPIVIPVAWPESKITVADLPALLKPVVKLRNVTVFMHNAKFDMHFLERAAGVTVDNEVIDTNVLGHLINDTLPGDLKGRARHELKMDLVEFRKLFDLTRGKTLLDYPLEAVAEYAGSGDAVATYRLGNKFSGGGIIDTPQFSVGGSAELTMLYKKIEHKITRILYKMEHRGTMIDRAYIEKYDEQLKPKIVAQTEKIWTMAGETFNINSSQQLLRVLHRRKLNVPNTREETLVAFYEDTEDSFLQELLKYREYQKIKSTYIDGMLQRAGDDDTIHTSFNQTGTETGRFSSSGPNLQNIPRDGAIRLFFRPRPGYVFVVRDFGQLELRVAAHVSGDKVMIDEFQRGLDIHRIMAAAIFNKNPDDITDDERQAGKATTSFGVLFGMAAFNLAKKLKTTEDRADLFIHNWFRKYRGVDRFFKRICESALSAGYVQTFLGRIRWIPELKSSERRVVSTGLRKVKNTAIQGGAADLVKLAMIECDENEELRRLGAHLLLQVHDELIFEVPARNAKRADQIVAQCMSSFPVAKRLAIPLTTDGGVGRDWNSAKKGKGI